MGISPTLFTCKNHLKCPPKGTPFILLKLLFQSKPAQQIFDLPNRLTPTEITINERGEAERIGGRSPTKNQRCPKNEDISRRQTNSLLLKDFSKIFITGGFGGACPPNHFYEIKSPRRGPRRVWSKLFQSLVGVWGRSPQVIWGKNDRILQAKSVKKLEKQTQITVLTTSSFYLFYK